MPTEMWHTHWFLRIFSNISISYWFVIKSILISDISYNIKRQDTDIYISYNIKRQDTDIYISYNIKRQDTDILCYMKELKKLSLYFCIKKSIFTAISLLSSEDFNVLVFLKNDFVSSNPTRARCTWYNIMWNN
jgi:hypothetical protein